MKKMTLVILFVFLVLVCWNLWGCGLVEIIEPDLQSGKIPILPTTTLEPSTPTKIPDSATPTLELLTETSPPPTDTASCALTHVASRSVFNS